METHGLVSEKAHRSSWPRFARHFLEMVAAMWIGMALGGAAVVGPILAMMGMTAGEARVRYPELSMVVMALTMTAPMVLWMRHRGHGWRSCFEISAAMIVPGIFLVCLFWVGATQGPACGLYCGLMIVAMFVVMLYRWDEYSHPMHVT